MAEMSCILNVWQSDVWMSAVSGVFNSTAGRQNKQHNDNFAGLPSSGAKNVKFVF